MTETPTLKMAGKKRIGRPFPKGHTGRPKGARNKATLAAEALLDGEAEALTRKAVEMALAGDPTALRLCLDRLVPPRRDRPTPFALPPLKTLHDASAAHAAIVAAVADGDLTPGEAADLGRLVGEFVRTVSAVDLEARVVALEEATRREGAP